jgi:hypothetical protein
MGTSMNAFTIRQHAADFCISFREAGLMRLRYLRQCLLSEVDELNALTGDGSHSEAIILQTALDNCIRYAAEQRALVGALRNGAMALKAGVTDELIKQARQYPIDQLVEFDRQGKAQAFCHKDKHPSLSWDKKRNRAHCFPCGKSFNPIDILTTRDGMSFQNAVRTLL